MIARISLILFLFATAARPAFVTIGVTFTNRTQIGDTFTRNSVTVRYTNSPLNSTSWIVTNNPAVSATNLWSHLGANMGGGRWIVSMTSPTNLTIKGDNAQFSISGTYAILTTNSVTPTNGVALTLNGDYTDPLKYHAETNKTNFASEILVLLKKKTTAELRAYYLSNELYLATRRSGGSDTNVFVTNSPSIQATNVATAKLTATSGELNGVDITNAATVTATLSYLTDAIVSNGLEVDGEASLLGAVSIGGALVVDNTAQFVDSLMITDSDGINSFTLSATDTNEFALTSSAHGVAIYVSNNVFGLRPMAHLTNGFVSYGTERLANIVRSRISGPIRTDEGAYSSLTGFSNNVVQLATNPVTRLSGATGNYNINSLRFADGIEAANRWAEIINDTAYTATIIDSALDGFETQATNRIRCGGVNLTLAAGASAKLKYSTSYSRWELMYPSPLAQFTISGTTNQVYFGSSNSVPANTATVRKWVSVQITGETNAYRLPLYE